ncbi:MAG TPA: sigma-70 family RNA polymerase sigma factor [Verrucomicrobiae bacterium]
MMNDDMDLLRDYAARRSEQAFATLVARHVHLVHSVALRQVRDSHLAGEITQTVFIILARKADSLGPKTILPGWLYRTAQFVSKAALKREFRRRLREQEAHMQAITDPDQTGSTWEQLSPFLDEAMAQLQDKDRDVIVLRYFENRSLKEIGVALGVEERAAQKRVARGLEKLRKFFVKRGIASTTTVIAGAISANSVQAAPIELAKTISAVAIAKGAAASTSTLTLIKGALKIMAWSKAKTAVVAGVIVLLATGTTTVIVKEVRSQAKQLNQSKPVAAANPSDWNLDMNSQTLEKMPPMLLLRPTKMSANWIPAGMVGNHQYFARGQTVKELIATIYSQKNSEAKLVFLAPLPDDKFDCVVTGQTNWPDALESEINKRFNLATRYEASDTGGTAVIVEKAQ